MTNKETPGGETPKVTVNLNSENLYTADEIDSLLSEINRDFPHLCIRVTKAQENLNHAHQKSCGWEPSAEQREALAWYGECRRRCEARKVEMFYALAMLARTLFRAVFAGGGKPD